MDTIRAATREDAERIAMLHADSWRTAYRGIYGDDFLDQHVIDDRLREWRDRFAHPAPQRHAIIIEDGAELRGFICVFGDDDPQWGSLIDNLHVAPALKRGGLGTVLMREGARWLIEHYARSPVYLWVLADNAPARRFYEKLGAHNAETVENQVPGGNIVLTCRYTWPSPQTLYDARAELAPDR